MRRLFFSLGLFLACCSTTVSQQVFEINTRLPGRGNHPAKALLVYNKDGSGFIRMNWYDSVKKRQVISDLDLEQAFMRQFPGENAFPVLNDTALIFNRAVPVKTIKGSSSFPAEDFTFWMIRDPSNSLKFLPYTGPLPDFGDNSFYKKFYIQYEPSMPPIGFIDSAGFISYKPIAPKQLTGALLKNYFSSGELVYPYPVTVPQLWTIREKNDATLFLITVTDNLDEKIKATTALDKKNVEGFFSNAARVINLKLKSVALQGENFNLSKVERTIRELKVGKNDVVVFAYSGHGFSYTNDPAFQYPQLALWHGVQNEAFFRTQSINLETIFNRIHAKGARLTVVIGDCCNTDAGITRKIEDEPPRLMMLPRMPPILRRNYMHLLMEARGAYIACAAQKGEPAAGDVNKGGFFTSSLIKHLNRKINSRIDFDPQAVWTSVLADTKLEAKNAASNLYCREFKGPCRQTAVFKKVKVRTPASRSTKTRRPR